MKTMKLMADYFSYPLWQADKDEIGNIDPAALPLDPVLVEDLLHWADRFDALFDRSDPANSGFVDPNDQQAFHWTGLQLWQRLQAALIDRYQVLYQSVYDSHPLRAFSLNKAQFAVILERAIGDPFVLNAVALAELEISAADVRLATEQLVAAGILRQADEKSISSIAPPIRSLLATAIAPQQQIMVQVRRKDSADTEMAVAFGDEGIVLDIVSQTNTHTFLELHSPSDVATLLIDKTPPPPSQASDHLRPLNSLLPQTEMMVTLVLLDSSSQDEQQAKASAAWFVTAEGVWWIDANTPEEQALALSVDALRDKLTHLFESASLHDSEEHA